jgi:group II intron reverse transcriptase/maturase
LERIREVARKDRKAKFTALLHHVTYERLEAAYRRLNPDAAAGVDGVTWREYGGNLEENLRALHGALHRGAYRAKPSRRSYIPKADGRTRPLGIAALEDKVVQAAVVEVLNAIYENDFLNFSYGFRPGRHPHQALDALATGILRRKVNWMLDADIRGYFDAINHEWLMKFIEHRIADRRILRLIQKWLNAGVMEDGAWKASVLGTPQGATISPLLANIYLHYAFDLWAHHFRTRKARGQVIVVRYADDFVVGFQHHEEAAQFLDELRDRLRRFGLELHPDKTRLVEFGRFAQKDRRQRGLGKPETFTFLGFTHICGTTKKGGFLLRRHTAAKRLRAKLKAVAQELRRRAHHTVVVQGLWLRNVIRGYFQYHAVPTNLENLRAMLTQIERAWFWTLRRRSDKRTLTWDRMARIGERWLPKPIALHPWPEDRFDVRPTVRA